MLSVVRVDNSLSYRRSVGHVESPFELFMNVPPGVVEVHVNTANSMVFPAHPSLFKNVQTFANIQTLRLMTKLAWCDLCNLDQVVALHKPFPQSLIYEGGKAGLSVSSKGLVFSGVDSTFVDSLSKDVVLPRAPGNGIVYDECNSNGGDPTKHWRGLGERREVVVGGV